MKPSISMNSHVVGPRSQHGAGIGQNLCSHVRQVHTVRVAAQKYRTARYLQLGQLSAEGGLGSAKIAGRRRDAAAFGNTHKATQQGKA